MKSKIFGIILAAGESKRLGQPKQLLKVDNEYLINLVITNSLESNLYSTIVVLGAYYNLIRPKISLENKIQILNLSLIHI
jgi:molybdenum cofactor cytidylyltransferase